MSPGNTRAWQSRARCARNAFSAPHYTHRTGEATQKRLLGWRTPPTRREANINSRGSRIGKLAYPVNSLPAVTGIVHAPKRNRGSEARRPGKWSWNWLISSQKVDGVLHDSPVVAATLTGSGSAGAFESGSERKGDSEFPERTLLGSAFGRHRSAHVFLHPANSCTNQGSPLEQF